MISPTRDSNHNNKKLFFTNKKYATKIINQQMKQFLSKKSSVYQRLTQPTTI
jgi:hypothetical protein